VSLAQDFMAHLNAALVAQLLDVTLAEGEGIIKPKSVLDNAQWETVAVRLAVSHGGPAYRA